MSVRFMNWMRRVQVWKRMKEHVFNIITGSSSMMAASTVTGLPVHRGVRLFRSGNQRARILET